MAAKGIQAWCLVKVIKPEVGLVASSEVVAMFNFDSEGDLFQDHIYAAQLNEKLVTIHPDKLELLERLEAVRAANKTWWKK